MLKTQSLCPGTELNLGDGVLGEVEKNSFTALPDKEEHSGFLSSKTVCPNLGGFGEEFYSNGSGWVTNKDQGVQGLHFLNLASGGSSLE